MSYNICCVDDNDLVILHLLYVIVPKKQEGSGDSLTTRHRKETCDLYVLVRVVRESGSIKDCSNDLAGSYNHLLI